MSMTPTEAYWTALNEALHAKGLPEAVYIEFRVAREVHPDSPEKGAALLASQTPRFRPAEEGAQGLDEAREKLGMPKASDAERRMIAAPSGDDSPYQDVPPNLGLDYRPEELGTPQPPHLLDDGTPVADILAELRELKAEMRDMKAAMRAIYGIATRAGWAANHRSYRDELAAAATKALTRGKGD